MEKLEYSMDEKDSGLILSMLRSKIYSDPIGSIVREIASNSRDANREAENADIPIVIEITDKEISFSDNGPGISKDRMKNVFCKYASSTKRNTPGQAGMYGLGAKTPFAYTNEFFVDTVVDGTLYEYKCTISDNQNGAIYLENESKTSRANGTKITIKFNKDSYYDKSNFITACERYFIYWDAKPTIKVDNEERQINDYKNKDAIGDNLFCFYKAENETSSYNAFIISVDGIPYPVDYDKVDIHNSYAYSRYKVLLKFDNNDLDISVNRENIYYSDDTINKINARIKHVKNYMKKEVDNFINSSKDYMQFCSRISEVTGNISSNYENSERYMEAVKCLSLNVDPVNYSFSKKRYLKGIYLTGLLFDLNIKNRRSVSSSRRPVSRNALGGGTVYLIGNKRKSSLKNATLYDMHCDKFILLKEVADASKIAKFMDLVKLRRCGVEIKRYSDIKNKKQVRKKSTNPSGFKSISMVKYEDINSRLKHKYFIDKNGAKIYDAGKNLVLDGNKRKILVFPVSNMSDIKKTNFARNESVIIARDISINTNRDLYFISSATYDKIKDISENALLMQNKFFNDLEEVIEDNTKRWFLETYINEKIINLSTISNILFEDEVLKTIESERDKLLKATEHFQSKHTNSLFRIREFIDVGKIPDIYFNLNKIIKETVESNKLATFVSSNAKYLHNDDAEEVIDELAEFIKFKKAKGEISETTK